MSTLLINTEQSFTEADEQDKQIFFRDSTSSNTLSRNTDPRPVLRPRDQFISVVDKFTWYSGKKVAPSALNRLPKAFIVEREQLRSSLISGALYYIKAAGGGNQRLLRDASDGIKSLLQENNSSVIDTAGNFIADGVARAADLFGKLENLNLGSRASAASDTKILEDSNLKSLLGIYLTKPTGFQYAFPYFENMPPVSNQWGFEGNTALQGLASKISEVVEEAAKVAFISQPGVYIQKPQYYQFEDTGKSITINLPLFNTVNRGTQNEYQRNYELLWLLAFQNKTYKTSFSRSMPSKIYSVTIPGIAAFPYSYISNMTIDFNGTVRNKEVSLPKLSHSQITSQRVNVPIPDAYTVSITFQSLLADYANIMMSNNFMTQLTPNGARKGDSQ
tara:strand:- start:2526 stop:3695 length:1170 start_codon:yes stop_codon:yes gene_type:complete